MEELLKMKAEVVEMRLPYPEKGDRLVRVYLPERGEGETFPVIYMTDGQNLFDEEHASWGCWHTREAVEQERLNSGRAAVIVGIHNDNEWRDNELTPAGIGEVSTELGMDNFTAPEGEIFDGFVIDTVMPAVEARFPVKRGRRNTAFCGSSSGGLQSFFTALSHPELFGMAGVFSPAFPLYPSRRFIPGRICTAGSRQDSVKNCPISISTRERATNWNSAFFRARRTSATSWRRATRMSCSTR